MRAHAKETDEIGRRSFNRRVRFGRRRWLLGLPGVALLSSLALAATASTASADRGLNVWRCPPPPTPPTTLAEIQGGCLGHHGPNFDFGDTQLGTTSPAQHFALGVFDNDSFNPRIRISGDYAQTNNCPPTLSAGAFPQIQGCLITVTFTPTSTGPREGTLSTGPGGPKSRLIGNGVTHPTPWPGLHLSAHKKQNPQEDTICDRGLCDVKVEVSCGDEECTARAKGKLTKVNQDKLRVDRSWRVAPGETILPGETSSLDLELAKESQRREVRKALGNGKHVQAKVTVRATYAAGKATAKRTIKLVK